MLRELVCQPATVEGAAGRQTTVTVLTVPEPRITARRYALSGQVKYENVEGSGYLEMWSHFPGRGQFFSRSLGVGAMQPLSGSSGWRGFALPFFITDESFPSPEKLVLNVVFPGRGRVELRAVSLNQFGADEDPMQLPGQWWRDETAGVLGGVAGVVLGCLGACLGWLTSRGRAQSSVLATMRLVIVAGILALTLGLYAFAVGQAYAVYYPLLLLGVIVVAVFGGLYRQTRNLYAQRELRKIQAQDS
jgi:hypothetical protein